VELKTSSTEINEHKRKKLFFNFHSDALSKFLQLLMNVAPPREYTPDGWKDSFVYL
jgi:hypothetical protein